MDLKQYLMIKKIVKYNKASYVFLYTEETSEKSEGTHLITYNSKYGDKETFKSIRGYKFDKSKNPQDWLFIDYALISEFHQYRDNLIDVLIFKALTLLIAFIALVFSIIAVLS